MIIPHAVELYERLEYHFPDDLNDHRHNSSKQKDNDRQGEIDVCKRLIGEDRKILLKATEKAIHFASKRVAHHNTGVPVRTTFADLDHAIDTLKTLAEKYVSLIFDEKKDLYQEMIQTKLRKDWDTIFLEPWATREMLTLRLGEMVPPDKLSTEKLTHRPSRQGQ